MDTARTVHGSDKTVLTLQVAVLVQP